MYLYFRLFMMIAFASLVAVRADFVQAQSVSDYVTVAAPGDWVIIDEIPEAPFQLAEGLQIGYQLVSYQSQIFREDKNRYRRFVMDLQTGGGVEDKGTITVDFDPSYQRVTFHHISIIRNGEAIALLDLNKFDMYRVETDRDKLLYNGDLQLGFQVEGLQVGDQLDYAYTISGVNPALYGSYFGRQFFAYSLPIRKLRERLVIAPDLEIYTKSHNEAPEPKRGRFGDAVTLDWFVENLEAQNLDEDRPSWYFSRPTYEVSGSKDWASVGAHFSPYYNAKTPPSASIKAVIDKIAAETNDPKLRTRKALDFVQANIRYLGIELGEGGFIPRAPDLVLERRFGDCKDVTYLLMTLLQGLGVEAHPVLVETDERGGFTESLAGLPMFNHVLVRAIVDGKPYFLDATRGEQLGDLDHIDQGSFQKGLLLDGENSAVISAEQTAFEWRKDFLDVYDLVGDPNNITMKTHFKYFGQNADWTKDWYESDGVKAVEKVYLDYFADFYPTIEQTKPIEFEYDKEMGSVSVELNYLIKDAWNINEDGKNKTFWVIPYEVKAEMPVFSGAQRSSPYALDYPSKIRQRLRFLVEDDWELNLDDTKIDHDSIRYSRTETFEDKVYEETYIYEAKRDYLPAKGFADVMAEIESVRDDYGTTFTMPVTSSGEASSSFDNWIDENFEVAYMISLFAAAIISILGAMFHINYDQNWRSELTLYPVGIKKFIFLSFWTFGHYQIYWFYKNWQWIKTVQKEDIWPIPRSIFAGIMNFDLFPRVAKIGEARGKQGYEWYGAAAIPLAILFLGSGILDRVIQKMEVPDWVSVLGIALLIVSTPVALQVLKYNEDRPDLVARQSHFSIWTWLLVALYSPLAILGYLGVIMILSELF